ncbi:formyltetrahydrofolate deformylase [Thalassiella azotivora]
MTGTPVPARPDALPTATPGRSWVLTLSCPDRPGIVHAVSGAIAAVGANIVESQQFREPSSESFFMRVQADLAPGADVDPLRERVEDVARAFAMSAELVPLRPVRTVVMVSREGHCLNDLLFRQRSGTLPVDVRAVVGNHTDLAELAAFYGVPFHHVPVTPETKPHAEQALLDLVRDTGSDLVVLARYMQVLSPALCERLAGRAINIHHSFLPSFAGARPYHQAYARGVKVIGATAHYVTADLDEGPIIEQDVERVSHAHDVSELKAIGRDLESRALARAVRWHAEHRVLVDGRRTVVFR